MEQYTSGQPRELVKSCLHMELKHGYWEAKRLLKEHFGNAYMISVAYINKALNWPANKSDDGDSLQSFGLYITRCRYSMTDVEFMEQLDIAANMCAIIAKFPNKLRERWRSMVCGIQEHENHRDS